MTFKMAYLPRERPTVITGPQNWNICAPLPRSGGRRRHQIFGTRSQRSAVTLGH
jgi:hypothetical protein